MIVGSPNIIASKHNNVFNSSGMVFHKLQGSAYGKFGHFFRSAFVRLRMDEKAWLCSNSPQKCSVKLRSGICPSQSGSSTLNSLIHVFLDVALCIGAHSSWTGRGHPQLLPVLLCRNIKSYFHWSQGAKPKILKNISRNVSPFHQTCSQTNTVFLATTKPIHRIENCENCDLSLQRTHFHCSRLQ